ncbi:hypothetical protein [Burkholderia stagnalis]|uniref:hypothetical protein n=1 Tax=Burkholderia stagnalis TaxID=1503054 RepID=UPI000B09A59C|nr:hypothetical protein [Burkholderia stagnalis]
MPGNNSSTGSADDLNRLGSFVRAMTQANADQGGDTILENDRKTAEALGERAAEAAKRWNRA